MPPQSPIAIFETLDPEMLKLINDTNKLGLADGALPRKVKFLIAMALDAAHGATGGVQSLAAQAMKAGATKEEITETLRVVLMVCGTGGVFSAAPAMNNLFQPK